MDYELRLAGTPEERAAVHSIRCEGLFTPERYPGFVYNDNHPDDALTHHHLLLLMLDGMPIGTTRLDLKGERGAVRMVAIVPEHQRRGHGAVMEDLLARHASRHGVNQLVVNSAPDAVGFYEKRGWRRETWDSQELVGMRSDCIQMVKDIAS